MRQSSQASHVLARILQRKQQQQEMPPSTHRRELEEHIAPGGAEQQALKGGQLLHRDGPRHKAQLHRLGLVRLRSLQQRGTYTGGGAGACGSDRQAEAAARGRGVGPAGRGGRAGGQQGSGTDTPSSTPASPENDAPRVQFKARSKPKQPARHSLSE